MRSPEPPGPGPGPAAGVGVDLVHVPSFVEQLARPGTRFEEAFTAGERRDARERAAVHDGGPGRHLAARWAAKEAFLKAWSDELHGSPPVLEEGIHHLVEVVTDAWGRPRIRLHGEVAERVDAGRIHVSLSHDGDHAIAYVVLSGQESPGA